MTENARVSVARPARGLVVLCLVCAGCESKPAQAQVPADRVAAQTPADRQESLERLIERLAPLQSPLPAPDPGDWLAEHEETGQSFAEYVASRPNTALGERRVIVLQPVGEFKGAPARALEQTAAYLRVYFQLPVRVEETIPLSDIPARAKRIHPSWGDHQVHAGYVLYELLKPRLADDAAALLALTTSDLWPGAGWNFVFGQASLRDRVGVWSLYRNGDPEAEYGLYLRRTLKTATHELGHVFGIHHEIRFDCNMAGCNHLEESDRRPLWLCHESSAKLAHATGADPVVRLRQLAAWCGGNGFTAERRWYERSLAALAQSKP